MRKREISILSGVLVAAFTLPGLAAQEVRGVSFRQEGLKVIEEKCLVCHNRKLIEEAGREQKDMEKIMGRMEKKGAVLTERERKVLGHFWGQKPFGSREEPLSPPPAGTTLSR